MSKVTRAQARARARASTPAHARTHPRAHTNTQKYIILIAFPQQQWLLGYMYTAVLFHKYLYDT